ncbi:SGNH/GDSL hydrolase family protein [Bordetella avium]|uniref:Capsular polysaccharide biosynthesis protein n=1 Tax=Bordetella avium (strain 197N) TaxID=360910 RepID=Q2KWP1_BORA1|nr:GDSL-type esterase/lipase family protein [Bordetella avium]RIQ52013.1 capsular biosynthesis protein [Bordetella avium]RIQ69136.1 capsular biosynthesis protein [Bordetella avium]CAJ50250.1 putative capsular polysaccharide biosynthesis protein [Bordetella avium 197N]
MPNRRTTLTAMLLLALGHALPALANPAPYAVVTGDSIAEGEIQRKGRLNVQGRFVPDYPSQPGQLSYDLAQYSGVFHYNQGIGGQTSTQLRARWPRDVLAQTHDPADGRGARTLPEGTQPALVYLHVGINDIAAAGLPLQEMQNNFVYFADTTAQRGIPLVIDNIGAYLGMTDSMIEQTRAFNTWLKDDLARRYPHVRTVDYLDWSSGGSGNYRVLAPGKFADGVHPSAAGYQDFARYIHDTLKLPAGSAVRY